MRPRPWPERLLGLGAMACAAAGFAAEAGRLQIPLELWDRPRSGRNVMAQPAIRQALAALIAQPEAKLAIQHAPNPESLLQAEEIKAWLAAHALSPARVELRPSLPPRQPLALEIVP